MVGLYLRVFVLALIVLQRLAVPVGGQQLSVLVPVGAVLLVLGAVTGVLGVDRRRLLLVAIMTGTVVTVTAVQIAGGLKPSLLAVGLFIVLWSTVVATPAGGPGTARAVGRFFVRTMCVFAVLSVAQFAAQSLGVAWPDLVAKTVSAQYVLQDFNPGNPITYGSTVDRTVGFVFLEPSFLSLFLGVAVVLAMRLRLRWPTTTLLLLGIVPTVAGNGLLIVLLGVAAFLLVPGRRRLAALLPAGVLAVVVGALTPLGSVYLARSTEGGGTDSSTGLRFIQPYLQLVPQPLQQPFTALFGRGGGSAGDWIAQHFPTDPLLATVFPKTLFEFGTVGVLGVLVPLVVLLVRPLRSRPELVGLVFAFLVVNDSLLSAVLVQLVLLVLLWLPDLAGRPAEADSPDHDGRDPAALRDRGVLEAR